MSRKHLTAFKHLVTAVAMMGFALSSASAMTDIAALEEEAKGQTVYFNAWGGDEKINAYISWAGQQMKERYDVSVDHVKLTSRQMEEEHRSNENVNHQPPNRSKAPRPHPWTRGSPTDTPNGHRFAFGGFQPSQATSALHCDTA